MKLKKKLALVALALSIIPINNVYADQIPKNQANTSYFFECLAKSSSAVAKPYSDFWTRTVRVLNRKGVNPGVDDAYKYQNYPSKWMGINSNTKNFKVHEKTYENFPNISNAGYNGIDIPDEGPTRETWKVEIEDYKTKISYVKEEVDIYKYLDLKLKQSTKGWDDNKLMRKVNKKWAVVDSYDDVCMYDIEWKGFK